MNTADENKLLILTARDAQILVGLHALFSTLLSDLATPAHTAHNTITLLQMFATEYSADEANALGVRLRALLPPDTCLAVSTPAERAAHAAQSSRLQ